MSAEAAESRARRFTKDYPGVTVSAIRAIGKAAFDRLQQELQAIMPTCDVFNGTDISNYPAYRPVGQRPGHPD